MVKVDKEKCLGCGICVSLCPEMFEMDKDNKSQIKPRKKCDRLNEIIDMCPTEAISE